MPVYKIFRYLCRRRWCPFLFLLCHTLIVGTCILAERDGVQAKNLSVFRLIASKHCLFYLILTSKILR